MATVSQVWVWSLIEATHTLKEVYVSKLLHDLHSLPKYALASWFLLLLGICLRICNSASVSALVVPPSTYLKESSPLAVSRPNKEKAFTVVDGTSK